MAAFRFRFRICTLLLVMLLVALAAWTAPLLHFWFTSVPIEQKVAEFNQSTMNNGWFKLEAELSEYEVTKALELKLSIAAIPDDQRRLYARILSSGRIPKQANFIAGMSFTSRRNSTATIDLEFTLDPIAATVPIREASPIDFALPNMDDPHRLNQATWAW